MTAFARNLIICVAGLLALATATQATTIPVPEGESTISVAMGLAVSGDTISIRSGYTVSESAPIRPKPGVRVEVDFNRGDGSMPVVVSSADTAFSIPAAVFGAGTVTTLSDLRIVGFSQTGIKIKSMGGTGSVVIEGCVIEGGNYGVEGYVPGSTSTVSIVGNRFVDQEQNALWIQDAPSSLTIEKNEISGSGFTAIGLEGGVPLVLQNTITNCGAGITKVGFITPRPTVQQNLVVGCTYEGIGCLGSDRSPAPLYYNDCWGNGTDYDTCHSSSPPYGNLSQDPLLCGDALTLHINSPCAPANNSWSVLIGARGIGCAGGNLANYTTLTPANVDNGTVSVVSDLRIPSNKALGVDGDVTLEFSDTDAANLGLDGGHVELIVVGNLDVDGTSGHPVVFKGAADAEGSWYGVDAREANICDIEYARMSNAIYGLKTMEYGTSAVSHSEFFDNSNTDILVHSYDPDLDVTIEDNSIDVDDSGTGIELEGDVSGVTISDNLVVGTSDAVRGVHLGTGTSGTTPTITDNYIHSFSESEGIRIDAGANPTITRNTIDTCKYGIYVSNGTPLIGTTAGDSDNTLQYNTNGVYVTGTNSAPKLRNNEIHSNTYGVNKKTASSPDLGVGGDLGRNDLSGNSTYCVNNQTSGVIPAVGNYWGVCNPGPPSCTHGSVLGDSALCVEPAASRFMELAPVGGEPEFVLKAVVPNPMHSSGVIGFATTTVRPALRVSIFDVSGRLLRLYDRPNVPAGYHEVQWDGRSASGVMVPAGLYLIRVQDGERVLATSRVLVVR